MRSLPPPPLSGGNFLKTTATGARGSWCKLTGLNKTLLLASPSYFHKEQERMNNVWGATFWHQGHRPAPQVQSAITRTTKVNTPSESMYCDLKPGAPNTKQLSWEISGPRRKSTQILP